MSTTPEQRAEWKALDEAATPGPWEVSKFYRSNVVAPTGQIVGRGSGLGNWSDAAGESFNRSNASFIAAARSAVPTLLADLEAAEQRVAGHHKWALAKQVQANEADKRAKRAERERDTLRAALRGDEHAPGPSDRMGGHNAQCVKCLRAALADVQQESGHLPAQLRVAEARAIKAEQERDECIAEAESMAKAAQAQAGHARNHYLRAECAEQERDDERDRADENLQAAQTWRAEAEEARAERDRHGPCRCNTGPDTQGPEEWCPHHGRTYDELLTYTDSEHKRLMAEFKRLRDGIAALIGPPGRLMPETAAIRGKLRALLDGDDT